jgi:hypothetical protein
MDKSKKTVAAVSAVMLYLAQEQEAIQMSLWQQAPAIPAEPPIPSSLWGQSGRQALMQMGHLMQMRTFQRRTN